MKFKTEATLKKALRSKRFSAGLRREAVEFSREAEAAGQTATDTARRLGMKPNTLQRVAPAGGKGQGASNQLH